MICGNDIRDGVVLVFVRRIMCLPHSSLVRRENRA